MHPKKLGKAFLSRLLESQVKRLRARNEFKTVAVVGSVGKTTTKLAIVKMLAPQVKLQHQAGNYNDRLTVPLVFFGQAEPGIFNILAWLKILLANERLLRRPYPYELVVLELGSDGPGQMEQFAYVQPDLAVVTALTDEHMAYFKTLQAVAQEELLVTSFSKQSLINSDDCAATFVSGIPHLSYGTSADDYQLVDRQSEATGGQQLTVKLKTNKLQLETNLLGVPGAKAVLAAAAVADWYGLDTIQIVAGTPLITAFAGRMQILQGIQQTTIIDDTYNSSPVAVKAALDVLYDLPNPQRIAVLGSMNEMGELSPAMHTDVGNYCDPSKVHYVITIGADAAQYLAPAAAKNGCRVESFTSPYEAAKFIVEHLQAGAVILVKGSQNGVFSEETVKLLLADPADASKLTRQSAFWMAKKRRQFGTN